ncbi:hypothetical protein PRZ48_010145 [Zasmidium cellare]|uniref:Uncharacterized protein n=1 Tax=Zasmidium cellare TaxID=395010 RepID=A0ABR0EDS3_ZASCE|nr:hypothetical protein PRZ48_010145 [Zasmidium cellare]
MLVGSAKNYQNRIRQAFHPQYYSIFEDLGGKNPQPERQMHIDLTPMEWTRNEEKLILKTDTEHTCRDFSKIHKWVARYKLDESSKAEFDNGVYIVD